MGRPRIHASDAAKAKAHRDRQRDNRKWEAEQADYDRGQRQRDSIAEATIRDNIRAWVALVGEDGLDAALRQARKRHHPDAGGIHEDFVRLSELTAWIRRELTKGGWGFSRLSVS